MIGITHYYLRNIHAMLLRFILPYQPLKELSFKLDHCHFFGRYRNNCILSKTAQ